MAWKDRHEDHLERRRLPVKGQGKYNSAAVAASTNKIWTRRANASRVSTIVLCCLFLAAFNFLLRPDLDGTQVQVRDEPVNVPTKSACDRYDGILHISQGDSQGAAGTIFFLFVVNQLLYAEKFNLLPWVHLNNVSQYVYDPLVHGSDTVVTFRTMHGIVPSTTGFVDPVSKQQVLFPGRPIQQNSTLQPRTENVMGNGVWQAYFEPVSEITPFDCPNLPMLHLTPSQLIWLHINWPFSVRAWRYGGMPPSLVQSDLTYDQWFAPMRHRASLAVAKYVHPKQHLVEAALGVNPYPHGLAMHIRHSDKANRRKRIPVKKFLPYAQAYYEEIIMGPKGTGFSDTTRSTTMNATIYLATDSRKVIDNIRRDWPPDLVRYTTWQTGDDIVRSNDTTAVFTISSHHHETNTQVLVDILALSKCEFIVHGLSAVSEAAMYLNQDLHQDGNRSVNLETAKHATVDDFRSHLRQWKSAHAGKQ